MLRKSIISLIILVLMLSCTTLVGATNSPSIFINGKQMIFQSPPIIDNGRTLVPLKTIFEVFNQQVSWISNEQSVTSDNIWLQINNPIAKVGNKDIILETPARIINSITYVPLGFIADSLNKEVHWDNENNRIDITDISKNNNVTVVSHSMNIKSLTEALQFIKEKNFVDLTHTFEPGIPHWYGIPDESIETLYGYEPGEGTLGSGFKIYRYSFAGQWGTHVDPPSHFFKGMRSVDQIDLKEMIMPLVVIDVHEKVEKNPDYTLTMADIEDWEKKYGKIPAGAFVAMRTDWSKRWPNAIAMSNKDDKGVAHYPGWSLETLKYLYEKRMITASGHEPTDTDPGIATSKDDYSLEAYILKQDHYQIELLANLDQVPEAGSIVVVSFPKPKEGSGFPARVFAIVP